MLPLVINVGTRKKPWENVPIEVLIEFERKKHERLKDRREQLRVPSFGYHPLRELLCHHFLRYPAIVVNHVPELCNYLVRMPTVLLLRQPVSLG